MCKTFYEFFVCFILKIEHPLSYLLGFRFGSDFYGSNFLTLSQSLADGNSLALFPPHVFYLSV